MTKVLITGMGVISSIGKDVLENRKSLIKGTTGIGKATLIDSRYADVFPFGEVKYTFISS